MQYLNELKLSSLLKNLSIDMVEKACSGHPGAPMGMSDFMSVFISKYFKFNPNNPKWINRDRLIFSNGHASSLLYSILFSLGYNNITLEDLKNFRQFESITAGHPEFEFLADTTTGPLGQGIAASVGFAIASKKLESELGEKIINHKIYVTIGDGCLMEGISHEACSIAGHLQLNNLIALFDSNNISIDGEVNLSDSTITKKDLNHMDGKFLNQMDMIFLILIMHLKMLLNQKKKNQKLLFLKQS